MTLAVFTNLIVINVSRHQWEMLSCYLSYEHKELTEGVCEREGESQHSTHLSSVPFQT